MPDDEERAGEGVAPGVPTHAIPRCARLKRGHHEAAHGDLNTVTPKADGTRIEEPLVGGAQQGVPIQKHLQRVSPDLKTEGVPFRVCTVCAGSQSSVGSRRVHCAANILISAAIVWLPVCQNG